MTEGQYNDWLRSTPKVSKVSVVKYRKTPINCHQKTPEKQTKKYPQHFLV